MAPQFVKPYVKTNKNDEADAEAICEAVARSNIMVWTYPIYRIYNKCYRSRIGNES